MKKIKILSHPTQIETIKLDELEFDGPMIDDRATKLQIRKWRKLRHQLA